MYNYLMNSRVCTKCNKEKLLKFFREDPRYKYGHFSWCKECWGAYQAQYRAEHVEQTARTNLRWRARSYGLDPDVVEQHFTTHNGCCDICGQTPTGRLCIDHDHKTGTFRGLLCQACNKAIGMFEDNVALLESAIQYLNGGM